MISLSSKIFMALVALTLMVSVLTVALVPDIRALSTPESVHCKLTVDGETPGEDNIFTFELQSLDGSQTYAKAQNDSEGTITFPEVSLDDGTYSIIQVPTEDEKQNHPNMVFDENVYTSTGNGADNKNISDLSTTYYTKEATLSADITFENVTVEPTTATILATKTLNGIEPGTNNIFEFELYDENNKFVDRKSNTGSGTIAFKELTFNQAGTYTYTIREVKGDRTDISYNTEDHTVTVTVTETIEGTPTDFNFDANPYYGLTESGILYMSPEQYGKDMRVYCMDSTKPTPPLASDIEDGSETITYSVIKDPSEAQLISYSEEGIERDTEGYKEKLRKLMYYFETHPDVDTSHRANLVWEATSTPNQSYPGVNELANELTTIYATTNVPNNYQLALFYPSGGSSIYDDMEHYQPVLGAYFTTQSVLHASVSSCTINNESIEQNAVTLNANPDVSKQVNGKEPTGQVFNFELLNDDGSVRQTKQNNEHGTVEFDSLTYTVPGTTTYNIREINDHQKGIIYDTNTYTATVRFEVKDFYDLSANAYYNVRDNESAFYVSKISGQTDFPVYSIDLHNKVPSKSGGDIAYSVQKNPSSQTLANYVTVNRYGDQLADNLRKLMYYFETNDISIDEKKTLMFAATTSLYPIRDEELSAIFAQKIPNDYRLALFIPSNYTHGSSDAEPPLLGAYGPKISYSDGDSIVFNNKKGVNLLPSAGGKNMSLLMANGIACIVIAGAEIIRRIYVARYY